MAGNYFDDGEVFDYTNTGSTAITSGSAVVMGALVGVALVDIAVGATGSVAVEGAWKLPRTSGQTYAQGAALYIDASTNMLTTTVGSNVLAGYASRASSYDAAVGVVVLKL